ncbi:hypothetical protein SynBMKMC1_00922 [Synechococcus sp. BMK-MC-1]|nr:hypothetical protein SynBMKMC1_00922 [Synechococcus sp. BMK-MC-1]
MQRLMDKATISTRFTSSRRSLAIDSNVLHFHHMEWCPFWPQRRVGLPAARLQAGHQGVPKAAE